MSSLRKILILSIPVFLIFSGISLHQGKGFMQSANAAPKTGEVITIYKNEYCGCCENWAKYIRRAGFKVKVISVNDLAPVNQQFGIPQKVGACHTAKLGDYYIVGHVSVPDILKLLEEKPDVMGLSVPGMPVGSPGMEIAGMAAQKYNAVLFTANGETEVFVSH
ncbi:MAG: DUF411 domain-containing protein [Sphingomonadales bacterium]